jgi:hypothetical protein
MLHASSNEINRLGERDGTHDDSQGHHSIGPQPVIGIPIPVMQDAQGPRLLADALGPWAIERVLGRVFLIPLWPFPTHTYVYQSFWPLLQSMDGLLLPASIQGSNWRTHWHERERHPGAQTWPLAWEIALAQLATSDETRSTGKGSRIIRVPCSDVSRFWLDDPIMKTNHPRLEGRRFYQLQLRPVGEETLKERDSTT